MSYYDTTWRHPKAKMAPPIMDAFHEHLIWSKPHVQFMPRTCHFHWVHPTPPTENWSIQNIHNIKTMKKHNTPFPHFKVSSYISFHPWGLEIPCHFFVTTWHSWSSPPLSVSLKAHKLGPAAGNSWRQIPTVFKDDSRDSQGHGIPFPYYSHIFRDSFGSGMEKF